MGLTRPGEETVYVHPTFLYESLWNFVGFLIINFYWYRKDHRKYDGQIFLFYVFWYGTGRAMVEGLRTDSLYIPGTNIRTSQLVAACSAVIALIILLVNIRRPHKPTFASVQAADGRRTAGAPDAGERRRVRRRYRTAPKPRTPPRTAADGSGGEATDAPRRGAPTTEPFHYNTYQEEIKMSDYSELLNSIKAAAGSAANIARDLAGNATEKARSLAGGAGEKARAAARIAKLKLDEAAKRDEREKAYAEIGRMYFESVDKRHPGEHYVRLFDQVMLCNAAIERMETEMRELKSVFESEDEEADFSVIVSEAEHKAEGEAEAEDTGDEDSAGIEVEITIEKDEDKAEDKTEE